jgi:chemotaxis family two-component system response regulator Rcp1
MTLGTNDRPLEILLVEDNPGDVELTKRILNRCRSKLNISVAEDGEVAMEVLRQQGAYANATRPDLIILDLNMPKKDGYEVLDEINAAPYLRNIPVMILTSTQVDRSRLYTYGINPSADLWGAYQKPIDLPSFESIINRLGASSPGAAPPSSQPAP